MLLENIYLLHSICYTMLFLFITILLINRHNLTNKNNIIERNIALLEQKNTDIQSKYRETQTENQILSDKLYEIKLSSQTSQAKQQAKEEALLEKITYLEKIKDDLTLKFKDISTEIIKSQHETFASSQKDTLTAILNPFSEQLKEFKTEVTATREESIKNKSNLDAQLTNLYNLNQTLSKDAQNLTQALKGGKKIQGNWGECQLSRILEISGLRKGQDYDTQETFYNEDKKIYRPDVIIHLPENREIVVDSKVSLTDYLDATITEDEIEKSKFLQKNLNCIKAHIDELSAKEYQKLLKNKSLNYVIMFIPIESAYISALEYDPYLYDYAYKRNIILATPLSLLPTLRTVENLWRIDSQNQNVQKIAELGGKIYDKLASFVEDMKSIERGINQSQNAYNNAMTKLSGRGSALSHAEKMKQLGSKTNKTINLSLNDNELLIEDNSSIVINGEDQ